MKAVLMFGGRGVKEGCLPSALVVADAVLAAIDGAIAALAFFHLLRIQFRNQQLGWTRQKILHLLIGSSNIGYLIYFTSSLLATCEGWQCWLDGCGFILMACPQILFLAAFLLLLSFWVDLCHQAKDEEEDDEHGINESFLEKATTKPGPLHLDGRRRCCSFRNIQVGSRQKFVVLVMLLTFVLMIAFALLIGGGRGENPIDSFLMARVYQDIFSVAMLFLGGALACYGFLLFSKMRKVRSEMASTEMYKVASLQIPKSTAAWRSILGGKRMVRKRRFAQLSTSDSDDDDGPRRGRSSRKKKVVRDDDDDEDYDGRGEVEEEEEETEVKDGGRSKRRGGGGGEEEEEEVQASPIGEPVRFSGKGRKRKKHYSSFEYEGNVFELEDPVLLTPATEDEKPYVAIIKDIADSGSGLMVTGQWFYRPEEAAKKGGGTWQARDTRELFYSFHLDDVPAESVMHRCVVHFVPLNKKLPLRSQHPGFIVRKVYDTVEKKLWKLTDKDYEDCKQDEINQLVKKTMDRLGELPDLDPEDIPTDRTEQPTSKWNLRRKNMPPIDTSRADGPCTKTDLATPASCPSDASEYYVILAKFKALTRDTYRDKWLEKLLQRIQPACNSKEDAAKENGEKGNNAVSNHLANGNSAEEKKPDAVENFCWPDAAVESITALEKASHETLGSDFQKYNQKMRQLDFNLKNNALLARRLLNKELDPVVILSMSPNELKDGLTADEKTTKEPEESELMQMTDARCTICTEKRVAVTDIIHAGGHGNRYQLECLACGHTWYASGDAISSLTIDAPNAAGNVGTAPWATAKFEDVEKKLVSPRDPEKPADDVFKKSTAAYMPVLETQKSFNRSRAEE